MACLCRAFPFEQLEELRKGKTKLMKFFMMGEALKVTRGRADGKIIEECMARMTTGTESTDARRKEGR